MKIQCPALSHDMGGRDRCPTEMKIINAQIPSGKIHEIEPRVERGPVTSNLLDDNAVYFFHNCGGRRKVFKLEENQRLKYHVPNYGHHLTNDQLTALRDKNVVVLEPVLVNHNELSRLKLIDDAGDNILGDKRYKPVITREERGAQENHPGCVSRLIHRKEVSFPMIPESRVRALLAEHEAESKRAKHQKLADEVNPGIKKLSKAILEDNAESKAKLNEVLEHKDKLSKQFDEAEKCGKKCESTEMEEKTHEKLVGLRQGFTEFGDSFAHMVEAINTQKDKIRFYEMLKESLPEEAEELISLSDQQINNCKENFLDFLTNEGKQFLKNLGAGELGLAFLDDQHAGRLTDDFSEKMRRLREASADFTSIVHKHYDLRPHTDIVTELSQRISEGLDVNDTEGAVGGATGGF